MYLYKKEELKEYPQFHDAILLCEYMGLQWKSIYMDREGGLAISFKGKLNEEQVKTVLTHFKDIIDGDTNVEKISCEYLKDYEYEDDITRIYTPDGYDYRNL